MFKRSAYKNLFSRELKKCLEENRSKRIIPEELINDPSKPIKKVPTMVKKLLEENSYTCVLLKDNKEFFSQERGVKPLLNFIDSQEDFSGFFASDKVVGKAASMLYILLNIKELFAEVISEPALEILQTSGIKVFYNNLVKRIENRNKDGFCPMEEVVLYDSF